MGKSSLFNYWSVVIWCQGKANLVEISLGLADILLDFGEISPDLVHTDKKKVRTSEEQQNLVGGDQSGQLKLGFHVRTRQLTLVIGFWKAKTCCQLS